MTDVDDAYEKAHLGQNMLLASQLLRIPQILHADEDYDTCDFDTAESKPRMEGILKPAADSANLKSDVRRDDYFFNAPEYECSIILDNFTSSKESELKDTITFMKGTHFYSNTKRSDCELPELIVCYRDNKSHGIKDICIDEGALLSERKNDTDFLFSEQVSFSRKDSDAVDCLDVKNDDKNSSDSDSEASKEYCNASDGDIIDDASDNLVSVNDSPQTSLKVLFESSSDGQELEKKKCPASILCYDSKVESGTITFNFRSRKNPSTTSKKSEIVDQPCDFRNENFCGESSSFATEIPSSDIITYSGQIPCSGSLSLGSDSSTTSTRSFAFPVLQQEWNSSPVRMAKAERGHFRKFKGWGWRTRLLCCRF